MPAQIKPKLFETRRNFLFFTRGGCVSCLRAAWVLGCFHSLISTQTPSTGLRHPSFNHCRIKFSYAIGPRKLSANEQFFVGAQTEVRLLQTTQIISDVCFITDMLLTPAQIKPKSFESLTTFTEVFGRFSPAKCFSVTISQREATKIWQSNR